MELKEKIIDLGLKKEESDVDINLRPKFLKEFIYVLLEKEMNRLTMFYCMVLPV